MKRSLSSFLIFALVFSIINITPHQVKAADVNKVYDKAYGAQFEEAESYAIDVYVKMGESYLYQNNDEENQDGRYTLLPKPLVEKGKFRIKYTGFEYDVNENDETVARQKLDAMMEADEKKMISGAKDAFNAFLMDFPQVFWLKGITAQVATSASITKGTGYMSAKVSYTLTITPTEQFKNASANIEAFNDGVLDAIASISAQVNAQSRTEEKARIIHKFVMDEVEYDTKAAATTKSGYEYAHTALPVFTTGIGFPKTVVCEGYAKAEKILCDRFNIENALLTGTAMNTAGAAEFHMWNAIKVDGKWYVSDATWDDSKNGSYTYFLAGKNSNGYYLKIEDERKATGVFDTAADAREFVLPIISDNGFFKKEVETTTKAPETTTTKAPETITTKAPETTTTKVPVTTKTPETTKKVISYNWVISGLKNAYYTGKPVTQKLVVKCNGKVLKEGVDYKVTYESNINVGTAKVIITPIGQYKDSSPKVAYFRINKLSLSSICFGKIKTQKYRKGKACKPTISLKFAGKVLKGSKYFSVKYYNNKKKGTAKMVIIGKGIFTGTKTIKFKIK